MIIPMTHIESGRDSEQQRADNQSSPLQLVTIHSSGEIITTSLFSLIGIMVNKEKHPQMVLIWVSEIL